MDAAKLIRYTHAARRGYLKTLSDLPWNEVIKDRGASFYSIRDIFLHALDMEDRLVNYVIPGKSEQWAQQDYGKFTDMCSIEKRVYEVEEKVEAYLAGLTQRELEREVTLPRRRDPPITVRAEDILLHVTIETASHMGELIALLWQDDKQPPFLSWSGFLEQESGIV